jgi:hypothetical protein
MVGLIIRTNLLEYISSSQVTYVSHQTQQFEHSANMVFLSAAHPVKVGGKVLEEAGFERRHVESGGALES